VDASPVSQPAIIPTPTFDIARLDSPPTVYPPAQADNGAQTYWGMCIDCHGDRGQSLTDEWLDSFPPEDRDCWASGCHAEDFPENSFVIPLTGIPAIAGPGTLARFANTFEMWTFIRKSMPLFPAGSLTDEEAWSLTAYVLSLNGRRLTDLTLTKTNGAAIPVHRDVQIPESEFPGVLILSGVLILAIVGMGLRAKRNQGNKAVARANFFHHLHPVLIPKAQALFRYTLGAGGLAIFFSLILLLTGLLETYYYIPTPEQAANSVETITTLVPLGNLIRNLHYWAAQFLVVVTTVHLLRVMLTGAYAPPRRFNYLLGLGLLVLILLLNFTGYVLRWDEGIRWALVVGTNLLKTIPWIGDSVYHFVVGGDAPGTATLTRFYAWHIFGLALVAAFLIGWHAFRVRRDGGVAAPPVPAGEKERITRFELVRREVLTMVVAGVILLLFSSIIPAPIERPISDANVLMGDSQAPWFFLWVQQLLKWGDPFVWGVLVPVLVIVLLGLIPYILPNASREELGSWFVRGNRFAQVLTVMVIFIILLLTVLGSLSG
jgi:quinol-cytochrome oxidoreductase complex cytochrome b subunit/mono/diheme cytochrome c family protein